MLSWCTHPVQVQHNHWVSLSERFESQTGSNGARLHLILINLLWMMIKNILIMIETESQLTEYQTETSSQLLKSIVDHWLIHSNQSLHYHWLTQSTQWHWVTDRPTPVTGTSTETNESETFSLHDYNYTHVTGLGESLSESVTILTSQNNPLWVSHIQYMIQWHTDTHSDSEWHTPWHTRTHTHRHTLDTVTVRETESDCVGDWLSSHSNWVSGWI